jgi:hypothetical protein
MSKIKVYGASDDLILIEGNISEEVMAYNAKKITIRASDGTIAKIGYDGNWHITVISNGPGFVKIVNGNPAEEPHTDEDAKGSSAYSDVLVLTENIAWLKIGKKTFYSI